MRGTHAQLGQELANAALHDPGASKWIAEFCTNSNLDIQESKSRLSVELTCLRIFAVDFTVWANTQGAEADRRSILDAFYQAVRDRTDAEWQRLLKVRLESYSKAIKRETPLGLMGNVGKAFLESAQLHAESDPYGAARAGSYFAFFTKMVKDYVEDIELHPGSAAS